MEHKKVLLVGAAGLIGKSLLKGLLAETGYYIVAVDIVEANQWQLLLANEQVEWAGRCEYCQLDLNQETSVKQLFQQHPDVVGIVNCSYPRGQGYGEHLLEVSLANFNQNVTLHLGSAFLLMQQAALCYIEQKRPMSIVNFASIYGVVAPDFDIYKNTAMTMPVEYAAVKSALIHLSKYMVSYVGESDFRVNCISPGGIFDGQEPVFVDQYTQHTNGKGLLAAEDLFGTVNFLLSEQSKFVTGQNIVVDDGFCV